MKLRPWMLVMAGVILNIISALITNNLIDSTNDEIAMLTQQDREATRQIDALWERIQDAERKQDSLMVLKLLGGDETMISRYIEQELNPYRIDESSGDTEIIGVLEKYQNILRKDLDAHYIDNVDVQERIETLEAEVSRYRNVALFLQMMGLILVLARDLEFR